MDKDTSGVPGSPDITATILQKIEECGIFVADISTLGTAGPQSRAVPNPNVLFELGYAWRVLGDRRVLLICNTAYSTDPGNPERDLRFDLRKNRLLRYSLEEGQERKEARERLVKQCEAALKEMLPLLRAGRPSRPAIGWRSWLDPRAGSVTYHREFSLDTDGDGHDEQVFTVGMRDAEGRPSLHVLIFRFIAGGWKCMAVPPVIPDGDVFVTDCRVQRLTSDRARDVVLFWNCGGGVAHERGGQFPPDHQLRLVALLGPSPAAEG